MKCLNCRKKVEIDQEGDLIHIAHKGLGVDERMCEPYNVLSKYAKTE